LVVLLSDGYYQLKGDEEEQDEQEDNEQEDEDEEEEEDEDKEEDEEEEEEEEEEEGEEKEEDIGTERRQEDKEVLLGLKRDKEVRAWRFLKIATSLPLFLQMLLVRRVYLSPNSFFEVHETEAGLERVLSTEF